MAPLHIVKLGGSIITDKKRGRPVLRVARVKALVREIAQVRAEKPGLRLVLLHGAGSFGHPLAHRYRLLDRPISAEALVGAGATIAAMRELGSQLAIHLLGAGIPVVPLQTSSFIEVRNGRLHCADFSIIKRILRNGGVPLFGGDVVFTNLEHTAIASADSLAVLLAKTFKDTRLCFATDIDGVYAEFPSCTGERPLQRLDRRTVRALLKTMSSHVVNTDVTGGMSGKLRALLGARHTTATIFNGTKQGTLVDVLSGKKRGTTIFL